MTDVQPNILTVSQLNTYISSVIDSDIFLSSVAVTGEISNFTNHYRTGHFYLTLKDDNSLIKAVMFKSSNNHLRFMPENGMKVIAIGRISVFERDGIYQLYIEDMVPDGMGALNVAFEQLKEKLSKQGLFSDEHKKQIPEIPKRIGVITSPTGAALQDIINIISRRFPMTEIILEGVEVQGANAPKNLTAAVRKFDMLKCCDVLIIGRGGGSAEDLWAFNDENLAKAIYDCSIPVISAVGHETDFTICDYVADLRAPTPSAAAELAVPDIRDIMNTICAYKEIISSCAEDNIRKKAEKLSSLSSLIKAKDPGKVIDRKAQHLDNITLRLDGVYRSFLQEEKCKVSELYSKLSSMDPFKVMLRGYCIAENRGKLVRTVDDINPTDHIKLKISDGEALCEVKETVKE